MILLDYLLDPAHWSGDGSIPAQVLVHLGYSAVALLVALVVAVPAGVHVGRTGRGEALVAGAANALRALPTLGLLILVVMVLSPLVPGRMAFTVPAVLVLVLLAVPPVLTGAYTGVQSVDPDAVDAARGLGYSPWQVLWHVQLPCALPLLLAGVRSATLQIVSTATVAAYVSLDGLGRFIIDGRATGDYPQMAAGALLVAALALLLELAFLGLGRLVVPRGLRRPAHAG